MWEEQKSRSPSDRWSEHATDAWDWRFNQLWMRQTHASFIFGLLVEKKNDCSHGCDVSEWIVWMLSVLWCDHVTRSAEWLSQTISEAMRSVARCGNSKRNFVNYRHQSSSLKLRDGWVIQPEYFGVERLSAHLELFQINTVTALDRASEYTKFLSQLVLSLG